MDAYEELREALWNWLPSEDDATEGPSVADVDRLIEAYRLQVLREAAADPEGNTRASTTRPQAPSSA